MKPNWKAFVDELIIKIETGKTSWGKNELIQFVKDEKLAWLERYIEED